MHVFAALLLTLQYFRGDSSTALSTTYKADGDGWYYAGDQVPWNAAEQWCQNNHNAHLASFRNEEEFNALATACANKADSQGGCWIGLERDGSSWSWSDGSALAYGFDIAGTPTEFDGSKSCVIMKPSGSLKNVDCDVVLSSTTEKRGNQETDVFLGPTALCAKKTEKKSYELILNHNNIPNSLFSTSLLDDTGLQNEDDPDEDTYSIIGMTDEETVRGADGAFHFKLEYRYDEVTHDRIYWSQKSWLTDTNPNPLPELYDVPYQFDDLADKKIFQLGLVLSSNPKTYLDGNADDGWWISVGAYEEASAGGVPAYNGKLAYGVSLYVATHDIYSCSDSGSDIAMTITACDDWDSASTALSMSAILRGSNGTTPFLQVNSLGLDLPTDGGQSTFCFNSSSMPRTGPLFGVSLMVNDVEGYCLKEVVIEQEQYNEDVTTTFELGSVSMNWSDAESWCENTHDAPLVSVRNEEEFAAACSACVNSTSNESNYCWVGLEYDDGSWSWSDGAALAYGFGSDGAPSTGSDPWASDEPDDAGCGAIYKSPDGTCKMYDRPCSYAQRPLCAKKEGYNHTLTFGSEYFGRGVVLSSQCDDTFVSVLKGDDDPLLPCFDEGLFDLSTYSTRGVFEVEIHSCNIAGAGMDAPGDDELKVSLTGRTAMGNAFISSDQVSLTFSEYREYWSADEYLRLEINVEQALAEVTLVTIGYSGGDALCVDLVHANGQASKYLSHNWLGGGDEESLTAVFKYPVCATEVIGIRVDLDHSTVNLLSGDTTIVGLECKNRNRVMSSTCTVSQSYETSKATSFAFSEESVTESSIYNEESAFNEQNQFSETSEYSEYAWGTYAEESSATDVGTVIGSSESTSKEFSFAMDQTMTVGASMTAKTNAIVAGGEATASVEVSVGFNEEWTDTSETTNSKETSESTTTGTNSGTNEDNMQGNGNTSGGGSSSGNSATSGGSSSTGSSTARENSWETTETSTVTCEASMDVVPGHSVSYSLIFNSFNTTIKTYTDMKLTLCSAMLHGKNGADENDVVYVNDIPGTIEHHETTACEVQFGPAEYIKNEMSCIEEQRLAIAAGATYIPRCQSTNSSLYDGCQCDIGDSLTMGVCYCVDETGNALDDQIYQFGEETFEEVCVNVLGCDNSEVTTGASAVAVEFDPLPQDEVVLMSKLMEWEPMKEVRLLVWVATATLAMIFAAAAMYVVSKCVQCMSCGNSKRGYVKQLEMADEEEMA